MDKDKILLITGGTGSFGNAVLDRFLSSDVKEIRIFSRDEKKQDDMRKRYKSDKLKFYLGDVRDSDSISSAIKNVNYVFHAAALKQVPSCEFYPMEAFKTNVLGTENLINSAISNEVEKVICLSTDKAVYPINAMGISKAMMEKVAIAKARDSNITNICITRYGNVMASRGSVIPLFINQIKSKVPITITDPNMTRFLMSLEDAVDLVLFAFTNGNPGDTYIQKAPAATIGDISKALLNIFHVPKHEINIIGTRHGEKLYEVLCSREEMASAKDIGDYFQISPDNRDLNYEKYYSKGEETLTSSVDFNSHNAERLNSDSLIELLEPYAHDAEVSI